MTIFPSVTEIEAIDRAHQSERPYLEEALIAQLKTVLENPSGLKRTVRFMFEHLSYIHGIEGCEPAFVEIVSLLGTLPMRLGFAKQWYTYVDSAYQLCIECAYDKYLASILLLKTQVCFDGSRFDEALDFGIRAIEAAKSRKNPVILAQALSITVTLYLYKQQSEQALALAESIDQLAIITEDSPTIAQIYLKMAFLQAYRKLGIAEKMHETIAQAELLTAQKLDKSTLAVWHHNVGLVKWYLGEHAEALARYRLAKDLYAQVGDISEIGLTADIGLTLWTMGDLEAAIQYLSEAQAKADQALDYLRGLKISSYLGLVHLSKGELDLASKHTTIALDKATNVRFTSDIYRITGNRGIIRLHLGDYSGALQDMEFDRQSLQEKNQDMAFLYVNLARLHNLMGDRETGRSFALQALEIAMQKQYRPRRITALRALAECSDRSTAIDLLHQALDLARDYQFLDEAACYLSLAGLVEGELEKQTYWNLGTRLLHRIGAGKWLTGASIQHPPLIPLLG